MPETPVSREQDVGGVYRDILAWSTELPRWQQELLRRVVREQGISQQAVDELAAASVREAEQQPSPYSVFSESDLPSAAIAPDALVLEAVADLRNVNALRAGQTLTFGRRLTVVYGDNASGKSGYARVLKKVYRARAVDEILGDVRAEHPSVAPPSARFHVRSEAGPAEEVAWEDGKTVGSVGRFAVLDAACSSLYMGGGALAYGPAGLDVPQRFAEELDRVKKRLVDLAASAMPDKTPLLPWINESTPGGFVRGLSSATTEAEIVEFTTWTPAHENELIGLGKSLVSADAKSPSARRADVQTKVAALGSIISRLTEWRAAVDAPHVESVRDAAIAVSAAHHAVAAIEAVADSAVPLDLAQGQVWVTLLNAASHFVESVDQARYTAGSMSVDEKCVLCWQDVGGEAQRRLERFQRHLAGTAISTKRTADERMSDLVGPIRAIPLVVTPETAAVIGNEEIAGQVNTLMQELVRRRTEVLDCLDDGRPLPDLAPLDGTAIASLQRLSAELQAEQTSLPKSDAEAETSLARMKGRILELRTRKGLSEARDAIRTFIAKLRENQRLQNAANRINTRAASSKASEFHTKHMTDKYKALFDEELRELRFRRRRPELTHKTSKARVEVTPLVSVDLRHIPPERVFSEGERTAIALACFLAEVRLGGDPIGLIFDDPVSSLDHNVREHVARRLVDAARDRQVIVFTHDLAFLADVREQATKIQKVECEFRTLVATDYEAGFVVGEEPFGARNVKKRIGALRQMIVAAERSAKEGDMTSLRAHGKEFYECLRSTWERFIEERLFASVVQRLERNVTPGALPKVTYTRELGEQVHEGWRRCSAVIEAHDHAPAQGGQSYRVEDMKADLEGLLAADMTATAA